MSTAVIISGQMRTFPRCYPTQRWQVYRHYEKDFRQNLQNEQNGSGSSLSKHCVNSVHSVKKSEPHFFVSCCDDENAGSAELLRQHYANVHIEKWTDPTDLPEIPYELGYHAPYANAASHEKLMLQHWGNQKAFEFFIRNAGKQEFKTIIRMRPDNLFHRFVTPWFVTLDRSAGGRVPGSSHCITPWWGKFGGINDRLAIMGTQAAEAYFKTYDKIPELLAAGCPFHPESLVAASLQLSGIISRTSLQAHFSTLRLNNDQRSPEIAAEDLAELIANA